jgi:aminoglycoside phosphotransferase (APT) family kinase protein
VKAAFGNDIEVVSTAYNNAGWFNTIYLLSLTNGDEVVLKVFPTPDVRLMRYERDIMSVEVDVMRRLRRDNVVPVPEILFRDRAGELLGSELYIMRKLEGRPFSEARSSFSEEQQRAIDFEVGLCCRRMNAIKNDSFGYYADGGSKRQTWSEAFRRILSDVLDDGRDCNVRLPMSYDAIYDLAMSSSGIYDEVTTASLVHWDLHDGNVFVDESGRITGIIDFERALWADPLMELNFGVMTAREAFDRGYGIDASERTPAERFRRAVYDVYVDLVMVVECSYREYGNDDHEQWVRSILERELRTLTDLVR